MLQLKHLYFDADFKTYGSGGADHRPCVAWCGAVPGGAKSAEEGAIHLGTAQLHEFLYDPFTFEVSQYV